MHEDSSYHQLAVSLLSKASFEDFDGFRTPGYPIFVALIYGISAKSVPLVLLMQIFLNLISLLLVYRIALIIFSQKIALLSAFLFAIDIHQAYFAVMLSTETLFVFLFLVSVYFLSKSLKGNNLLLISLSALFLGIATLVRPISFLFPLVAVISILVINNKSELKIKTKLVYSLLFCIVFIAAISPWLYYNYSRYGEAKISSIIGYNLLFYNVAYTEVYKTGKSIDQVTKNFYDLAVEQGVNATDKNLFKDSKVYSNIAKEYIKNNLILYSERNFMGILNMYTGIGSRGIAGVFHLKPSYDFNCRFGEGQFKEIIDFFQKRTKGEIWLLFCYGSYLLINYFFALFGIFILIKRNEKSVFLLILIILYFSILVGIVGESRYRLPIMPYINILCAVGLSHSYARLINYDLLQKKKTQ
jgi:4-amino-4-deoxy-L-arabinose transferase-like glycosyltransferase